MAKPFSYIRLLMARDDIDQPYLAEQMGKCTKYVNQRLTGRRPWDQDDQYWLMDFFHIPYDQMHKVFPKNGIDKGEYEIKGGAA